MKIKLKIKYLLLILLILPILPAKAENNNISLTWSTNTFSPIEYPGKNLPTRGSKIQVVASINNIDINPQEVFYVWTFERNHYLQEKLKQKNKQTFDFTIGNSIYDIYSVKLEIQDEKNNIIAQSLYISVKPLEPEIILNFNQKQVSSNQNLKITAMPYFFNISNIQELNYNWSFDNQKPEQIDIKNPNIFNLKINQISNIISKNLKLSIENKNNLMQTAIIEKKITLTP